MKVLLHSDSLRVLNAKRLQIIFWLAHPIAMTFAGPEFSYIDQRFLIWYEVLIAEKVGRTSKLRMKMQERLIEPRGFNLHFIHFIY